jgi:hypothetical protein
MRYVIMGEDLDGCMEFLFDDANKMILEFRADFQLSEGQAVWMAKNFPTHERILLEVWKPAIKAKITAVLESPKFAAFWDKYENKQGKADAQKAWAKLSDAERVLAIRNIPAYKNSINSWQSMLMAATYLNKKRFMDYVKS